MEEPELEVLFAARSKKEEDQLLTFNAFPSNQDGWKKFPSSGKKNRKLISNFSPLYIYTRSIR